MKAISGYLLGAVLMAVVGTVCLVTGFLDRDIAHAQEHIVSGDYDEPQETFHGAERYYEYASRLPWVGNTPLNDMRAREAALQYWQQRYVTIVPEVADPIANTPADNVDLQLVVANAMYREGLRQAKDKATIDAAFDASMNAYASVLRNTSGNHDAAYNYELAARLKNDVDKGKRKVPMPEATTPGGLKGHIPSDADEAKYKVYVPLESNEIDKNTPSKAGKQPPIQKKG